MTKSELIFAGVCLAIIIALVIIFCAGNANSGKAGLNAKTPAGVAIEEACKYVRETKGVKNILYRAEELVGAAGNGESKRAKFYAVMLYYEYHGKEVYEDHVVCVYYNGDDDVISDGELVRADSVRVYRNED